MENGSDHFQLRGDEMVLREGSLFAITQLVSAELGIHVKSPGFENSRLNGSHLGWVGISPLG